MGLMRVLYFHQHFVTPRGNGGIRSYQMARRLIARGHQVTMVCGSIAGGDTGLKGPFDRGVRRGDVEGIEVVEFALPYSNRLGFLRRIALFLSFTLRSLRLLFTERYDICFSTTTPLTVGIVAVGARLLTSKQVVFEVRDLWPELPRAMGVITNPVILAAMSGLEWASYHAGHRLIGLSPGIVAGIIDRGIPADRVTMIPNGCDVDIFSRTVDPWRPPGIPESDLMAVFAGTHGRANGLANMIEAASVLKKLGQREIHLVLVGDGSEKPRLIEAARERSLDNVHFVSPVSKERLAGLFSAADLGLQILADVPAFYFGTSPNKFFDYLAAGLPVLTNYPGWIADLVAKHRCGFVVPPGDPAAFAQALRLALSDRAALPQMGRRARALATTEFERKALADRWVDWVTGQ